MTRNTIELLIGAGSFMISLQLFCLSYLADGFGALWTTLALAALCFSLVWCFDDYLLINKREKRGRR